MYIMHSNAFITDIWCTYTVYTQDIQSKGEEDEQRQDIGLAFHINVKNNLGLAINRSPKMVPNLFAHPKSFMTYIWCTYTLY